ncbi:MAG: hypothetical protein M1524_00850 [Patescibacteria group bacterium]|nr:hypothetical protein [Patescibacteria group bacterium]
MKSIGGRIKNLNISTGILLGFIFSLTVSVFFNGYPKGEQFSILISATSFLFGIFVSFLINDSRSNLNHINEILKSDEATLQSIYEVSIAFGKDVQDSVRNLMDKYLTDQIDYYLEDFKYSNKSFKELYRYIVSLKPKNAQENYAYSNMLSALSSSSINRKRVETFVQNKILIIEWIVVLILLVLELFFIFYFNSGDLISIILSTLLSTSAIVLVLILKDFDNLKRNEDKWIWEPLGNLFQSLGLVPYYPMATIKDNRAKIRKGEKIRVAEYPNNYPDMSDKKVNEIIYQG